MSYRINICFKNCKKSDVYKNIEEFNNLLMKNKEGYMADNYYFIKEVLNKEKSRSENIEIIDNAIKEAFSIRFWYCDKIKALCVVLNTQVEEINWWFDGRIYFQNSCDQDYPYETWEFNTKLKKISDKIKAMTHEEFARHYPRLSKFNSKEDLQDGSDIDYYKRTSVYDRCYTLIEPIWRNGFTLTIRRSVFEEEVRSVRNSFIRMLLAGNSEISNIFNNQKG